MQRPVAGQRLIDGAVRCRLPVGIKQHDRTQKIKRRAMFQIAKRGFLHILQKPARFADLPGKWALEGRNNEAPAISQQIAEAERVGKKRFKHAVAANTRAHCDLMCRRANRARLALRYAGHAFLTHRKVASGVLERQGHGPAADR